MGISNPWNLGLVLPCVPLRWRCPHGSCCSLREQESFYFFFLDYFQQVILLIQLTPQLQCQLWEGLELEQGQAGHGAALNFQSQPGFELD